MSTPTVYPGPDLLGLHDNMLACIRCGLCLSVCPTYTLSQAEQESPRGRVALARAFTEGHLPLTEGLLRAEDTCLVCEACTAVCPTGVRVGSIVSAARASFESPRRRPLLQRLGYRVGLRASFASPRRFRLIGRGLRLYQRSGLQALVRGSRVLKPLGLDESEAFLPELPPARDFLKPTGQVWEPLGELRPKANVALFVGCIMGTAFAETARATARVLARAGCRVEAMAGQGCCGALHSHNGDLEEARALARRNLAAFDPGRYDALIVNAAGCGSALKEYGELLKGDPAYAERAHAFSAKVRDVSEWLDQTGPGPGLGALPWRVTYQEPCHLVHAQRITAAPRRLLRAIPGLEVLPLAEATLCCGSAGIYNLTQPERSQALQKRKVEAILATGAEAVVTANPGCWLQVAAGLRARGRADIRVLHLVDLLDEAYRRGEGDAE